MTTIQCRDGEDVHEGQDNAEESGHLPEKIPIPRGREDATNRTESAQTVGALLGKHILQIIHISLQYIYTISCTCREGLPESVSDTGRFVPQCSSESQLEIGIKLNRYRSCMVCASM